jgi:hypothetical protein
MRSLILLMAATLAFAQDKPDDKKAPEPAPQAMEAEVIQVKTLTGDSFTRLMKLLEVFHAHVQGDSQLRTIVVYAPKDVVAQMRRVVEQLDRPGSEAAVGKNIDMTLTLLRCSTKASAEQTPLPKDMEPVARQLRAATQYKDIQLWDVVPLRLQEGKETTESLRLPGDPAASSLSKGDFAIYPEAVYRKDAVRFVRFSRVNLSFIIPYYTGTFGNNKQYTSLNIGLKTSGDFQEGQKTVLGKVSGTGEEDAIFAVIELKVLD